MSIGGKCSYTSHSKAIGFRLFQAFHSPTRQLKCPPFEMPKHFTYTFHSVDAQESIAIGSALPAVCLIVVALRFWTRKLQKVQIGADDWWAVAGSVSNPR